MNKLFVLLPLALFGARGGTPPQSHTVVIEGMAFRPAVITVSVGDTVVWINRDIVPHTATSRSGAKWGTPQIVSGARAQYVTKRKGTFQYICTLHPTMRGKLIVQ